MGKARCLDGNNGEGLENGYMFCTPSHALRSGPEMITNCTSIGVTQQASLASGLGKSQGKPRDDERTSTNRQGYINDTCRID